MEIKDKVYLESQFRNQIHTKTGNEFQSFFEDVMEKVFPNFQKIRPYGNRGDGGNDGYIRDAGKYFQVYAPRTPDINESAAAKKFSDDFNKLKRQWEGISAIKEYNFVFNDKYGGSTQEIECTRTILEKENPSIEFNLLLARDFQKIFFELEISDMLSLGFNIDQRNSIENVYQYLESLRKELDLLNAKTTIRLLEHDEEIIYEFDDKNLTLEFELLTCKCFQQLENIDEVKRRYKSLIKRFPEDPRPLLYLGEIFLNEKEVKKNNDLIHRAESINPNNWLLHLMKLIRDIRLNKRLEKESLEEIKFPKEKRIKSDFYRLFSLVYEKLGEEILADKYIERAIQLNPNKFTNYSTKLVLFEFRLLRSNDLRKKQSIAKDLLTEIENIDEKFIVATEGRERAKVILNAYRLNAYFVLEDSRKFLRYAEETISLILACYFDVIIEGVLLHILPHVSLPQNYFEKILSYLQDSDMEISNALSEALVYQFDLKKLLLRDGKSFFKKKDKKSFVDFICDIENDKNDKVLKFIDKNNRIAVSIPNILKDKKDLRKKILASLPDDDEGTWYKLLLLIDYEEDMYEDAFSIIKNMDLSKLNSYQCRQIIGTVKQKNAWDFEIVILRKLIEKEQNESDLFNLNLQLFIALQQIQTSEEIIILGEKLLIEDFQKKYLSPDNREILLTETLNACLERGKFDEKTIKKAEELLRKFKLDNPSYEFNAGIKAEVFIRNEKYKEAYEALIQGIKKKGQLSPFDYAKLYFPLILKIGNQLNINLESDERIKTNSFVKLTNKEDWYYIGDDVYLDAIPIRSSSEKLIDFIGKNQGDKIVLLNEYSNEKFEGVVEKIYPIEKYVFFQSIKYFRELSSQGVLEGVQVVNVPELEDGVDLRNLLRFFKDQNKKLEASLDLYCENRLPLAILAVNEGGILNAIGHINNENRGFINFSSGSIEEFEEQKDVARRIFSENLPFYLDGTSALFLSEIGFFQDIYEYISNIKVPQSVINFLGKTIDRFQCFPGQVGQMQYFRGNIAVSAIDENTRKGVQNNFVETIGLLEAKPNRIGLISLANKGEWLSEREIPGELCDACILSQSENIPIMTEDYLYLLMNEMETNKKAPKYFSSMALMRVLYELGKINVEKYFDYFSFLAYYRCRFLSVSSEDIKLAVFGDNRISVVKPKNIIKFNFPLIFSEEYGVDFRKAISVIAKFLYSIINDDSVTLEMTERIFVEIIEAFPRDIPKKDLGQLLIEICSQKIQDGQQSTILLLKNQLKHKKIDRLQKIKEIFCSNVGIWKPNS